MHTYDGDTPADARKTIRARAHIALTNPDMLHAGMLPHHPRWAKLFENLRYVVIDELHAYRGVFGSHLCNVLRRLQRICRHYGSDPQFICSSATIANPRQLAERLAERPFSHIAESGAPRGEKFVVFVNPPVVNRELGIRRSYLAEARRVAGEFLRRHLQVIVFAQSRLATEILTTYLKEDFETVPGMAEQIRGYRGGYLPLRRREIEKGLREGQVRGVVATNALELGIDIGALDVAVLAGYPGTIASTWQRAGRAGRRTARSAAVMVRQLGAGRSVRGHAPELLLRRLARARADQPRQPAHPGRSREVRGLRAALRRHRHLRRGRRPGSAPHPARERAGAPLRRFRRPGRSRPVALDQRELPGRRDQPALDHLGQLRRRRRQRRVAGDRRDRLHERPVHPAPEGDLPRGRAALPGGVARLRGPQGLRPQRRLRLLHHRDHLLEGHGARTADARRATSRRTATCTSPAASSASRKSSSTPTRTSARASSTCPSSRCTRPPTG